MNEAKIRRLEQLMPVNATATSTTDFLLTHVPFKNLYLNDQISISEQELLEDYILKDMEIHQFIMVQGNTGTGKSHLIRWLYENYRNRVDKNNEKILFISRSHNTLQDTIRQMLESDIFPQDIRDNELKALDRSGSQKTGDDLKRTIAFNFTLAIRNDKNPGKALKARQMDQLRDYLMNEYILAEFLMIQDGPLEKIRRKIETVDDQVQYGDNEIFCPEDFAITKKQIQLGLMSGEKQAARTVIKLATDLSDTVKGNELQQQVADYLNSCVTNVIASSTQLTRADFTQVFNALRKYLRQSGKTLTLFIEDINAFTGIDKALIEVLITDHREMGNEECCRLISVVGSTTDYYRNYLRGSIQDRMKTDVMIRDTSNVDSILGSKESRIRFAAAYLNAFHLPEAVIEKWEKEGMDSEHIPVASPKHSFSTEEIDGKKIDLFPFNVTALEAFFSLMPEYERSPRLFLKNVLKNVLREYYIDPQRFLSKEKSFITPSVPVLRHWVNPNYERTNRQMGEKAAERSVLLRMWGNATPEIVDDRIGGLTAEVFQAFDIPVPVHFVTKRIPSQQPVRTTEQAKGTSHGSIANEPPKSVDDVKADAIKQEKDVKNSDVEKLEALIREWHEGNDKGHGAYRQVREAFQDFILDSIDWTLHEIPMVLVENCIKGTEFVLEGSRNDEQIKETFVIERNEGTRNMLTGIVRWRFEGNRSWHFKGADDYYIDTMVWLENHAAAIIGHATRHGMSVEELCAIYVASAYGIKSLFEPVETKGVDLLKAAENIFNALPPTGDARKGCGPTWESLGERVNKKNRNMDKVFSNALSLFQMGVGGGYGEGSEYVVYDVMKVLQALTGLQANDWDIRKIPIPGEIDESKDQGFCAIAPIALLTIQRSVDKALEESQSDVDRFMEYMENVFNRDVTLESIKMLQDEVSGFSNFLLSEMNKNNDDATFRILYDMDPALLHDAYQSYKINRQGDNPVLLQINNNDMTSVYPYYQALKEFERFLVKYENEYNNDKSVTRIRENENLSNEIKKKIKGISKIIDSMKG